MSAGGAPCPTTSTHALNFAGRGWGPPAIEQNTRLRVCCGRGRAAKLGWAPAQRWFLRRGMGGAMKSVVGIFGARQEAERGAKLLDSAGIARSRIAVLTPQSTAQEIAAVPTMDAEQPGMGMALGATVGGAMGLAGGVTLGALASVLVPGVGPILAIGFAASALGLLGGGALGGKLDNSLSDGIPQEELYVYEDALRQGHSVVIAFAENHAQLEAAHHSLKASGAESVDRAREMWWSGLRDVEKEHYDAGGERCGQSEAEFRAGFEAAQHPANRDRSFEESRDQLSERHPLAGDSDAFRQGFERGRIYYQQTSKARAR